VPPEKTGYAVKKPKGLRRRERSWGRSLILSWREKRGTRFSSERKTTPAFAPKKKKKPTKKRKKGY